MQQSPIPHLDIVDQAGRRRRVHLSGPTDTVADLAVALGRRDGLEVRIAGLAVASGRPLTEISQLLEGSEVRFDESKRATDSAPTRPNVVADVVDVGLDYAVVTGPSCQGWSPLFVGRHGLGRSPSAEIRVIDPLIELHHAVLLVDAAGGITVTQLTGRIPLRVVRASDPSVPIPATSGALLGPCESLFPGDSLILGSSRIELRRRDPVTNHTGSGNGTLASIPGDPWHLEVRRSPTPRRGSVGISVRLPDAELPVDMPPGTALVGAAVAFAGALAVAALVHQTMFAVFALVGAFASAATWAVGAIGTLRRRRKARRASVLDRERFASDLARWHRAALDLHREHHAEIAEILTTLADDRSSVWQRRMAPDSAGAADGGDATAIEVVVGRGTCRVPPPIGARASAVGDGAADLAGAGLIGADVMALLDDCTVLREVAVPIRFEAAQAVAIRGAAEQVGAILRSFVVQVAATVGPADLRIVVVGDTSAWDWVRWLPHARSSHDTTGVVASGEIDRLAAPIVPHRGGHHDVGHEGAAGGLSTLLIVDDPALLAVRTGPLRRFMAATGATTLVAVDTATTVPTVCRRTLNLAPHGGVEWLDGSNSSITFSDVAAAGLDMATACGAARALAPLIDPETADRSLAMLPAELPLAGLDNVTTPTGGDTVTARWRAAGRDPTLRAPIGVSTEGFVDIDLVADGPHALVAGTTGSGKSELLRTWVVSMASHVSPEYVNFVLIDYKGGSTFDSCALLPHTVGVVTDLDGGLAQRALVSLEAELARRERLMRAVRVGDLTEYRRVVDADPIPRLVVVVDEFATLAQELPDFLASLVAVAQRGRSLGLHVVLATQRPAGVVTDDIRANTDLRIALRVNDASEARDVVGDITPASFSKSTPGRALLRVGQADGVTFQAARCTGPPLRRSDGLRVDAPGAPTNVSPDRERASPADSQAQSITELTVAVEAIRRAAVQLSIPAPRRPWLDPLPAILDPSAVDEAVCGGRGDSGPHDAIGVVDDPLNQCRHALRWDRSVGNLLIVGALASGRTSTIVALAAAVCRFQPPGRCHVYVVDALGDPALDALATIAHCGAVVRVGETERIDRLLCRLVETIDKRSVLANCTSTLPHIVLFVDGLGELRRSLDTIERLAALAMLDRILEAGPAVGVTSCLTVDADAATPSIATADRWVLGADRPAGASTSRPGMPASTVTVPGRLRVASSGLAAQVAFGAAGLAGLASRPHPSGPPDLLVLPSIVDGASLPASRTMTDGGRPVRRLVVGLASDDLEPAALCVPDGDHIFIGGAARTGTTTTLERIVAAWQDCEPDGHVLRWSASVAAVDSHADLAVRLDALAGGAVLLVIDDAERVVDRDGLLAETARGLRPTVTIVAAARVDAVRGAYGHWTREVARSRCGLVMTAPGEIDGDLLGTTLPRRTPVVPRPGLAWMIDGRGHRLVQVAARMPP